MAIETYQLCVQGVHTTEFNEVCLDFESNGSNPADTAAGGTSLIDGFIANVETAFLAALPPSYELRQYTARRVAPVGSITTTRAFAPGAKPGTAATSTGEAFQICPCITWIPPIGIKSSGRTFLPTIPQGSVVNNAFSAGYQVIITTLITALLTAFSNAGISWVKVILSRKLSSSSHAMSGQLSGRVGYQRRRRAPTGAGV